MSAPAAPPRFRTPDTTLIIFGIIVLAAVLTWLVPPGAFARTEIEVPGVGTREVVVPGSYERVERGDAGVGARLAHTVAMVFQAPILGFVDPEAAPIIAFVLLVGGAFAVLTATGAIDAALRRVVEAAGRSPAFDSLLIPLFMTLFSLGGAVFGMSEETIPFVLIFVPLALALGYDSLTGAAIPFLGSAAGFASAFLNPFTVGVAQGIAGVAPFSGLGFRVGLWVVSTAVVTGFVVWHARRVRRDPTLSPVRRATPRAHADRQSGDARGLHRPPRRRPGRVRAGHGDARGRRARGRLVHRRDRGAVRGAVRPRWASSAGWAATRRRRRSWRASATSRRRR